MRFYVDSLFYLILLLSTSACSYESHAPADFSINLDCGDDEVHLSGTAQTFTRKIIFAGDTTVNISFSRPQLDSIYQELSDMNYNALPANVTALCTEQVVPRGSRTILTIRENGRTKQIVYDDDCYRYAPDDIRAKRLRHIIAVIIHMTERNPVVKNLPESGFIRL
ncbi:hypothetical protein [Hymenobacter metallilatus]|uniref:Lipoprotein n=1 Tax=Hymenobacter metallilatus TaxID=2493666 RepID=A0A428JIJ6_9BACT|nr:hypothetical protein [Hymenobacter metallilatus]RSK32466.1 hypothetical protein EI290_12100 [Hymenobacter metallilatus]